VSAMLFALYCGALSTPRKTAARCNQILAIIASAAKALVGVHAHVPASASTPARQFYA
jgi:hypothetical protein